MDCYHIWTMADSQNALFRAKRCFGSRGAANAVVARGGNTGDRGKYLRASRRDSMVLKCRDDCPCRFRGCPAVEDGQ